MNARLMINSAICGVVLGVVSLAAGVPAAVAEQVNDERTVERDRERLGDRDIAIDVRIMVHRDGERFEVIRRGDDLRVMRNGERVPDEQIERDGRRAIVRDADGRVALTLRLHPDGAIGVGERRGRVPRIPDAVTERQIAELLRDDAPRGWIGVTLGPLDEALAAHLDVDPEEVVMITRVREGRAADKAGLKRHDVVIAINGERPATPERLQRAVRERDPGETITLTVLRGSETHEITIEIEGFEPGVDMRPFTRRFDVDRGEIDELVRDFQRRMRIDGPGFRFETDIDDDVMRDFWRDWMDRLPELDRLERGWRDRMPHVGAFVEDRAIDRLMRKAAEALQHELKALRELDLDVQTKRQLDETLDKVIERLGEVLRQAGREWAEQRGLPDMAERLAETLRVAPQIEITREGDARVLLIQPRDGDRRPWRTRPDRQTERAPSKDRLDDIEARLDRIEQMLRRMIESRQE